MEEMETLRKSQKGNLEINNKIAEIKNAFHGFISKFGTAQERTSELEGRSIKNLLNRNAKSSKKQNNNKKPQNSEEKYARFWDQLQKECHTHNWNIRRRREWSRDNNGQERYNIHGRQETTNQGASENIKQDKYQMKHTSVDYIQTAERQRENIVVMGPQLY